MKHILLENAYESWAMAIKYCDALAHGMATLSIQKNFVSCLHNAVELFLKQMMIDSHNHDVASMKIIRTETDAQLILDYMRSEDLNNFFANLTKKQINRFYSIEFNKLIELHKKIIPKTSDNTITKEILNLLQELRNNETHFFITSSTFLSEKDFVTLHNFMVQFYKILLTNNLFPFWEEPVDEHVRLDFSRRELDLSFSYVNALKQSKFAQQIVRYLHNSYEYGTPGDTSYRITYELCTAKKELKDQFDDIWIIIEMLLMNNLISYTEDVEELPKELDPYNQHPQIMYQMNIKW